MKVYHVPYKNTGFFTPLILDYLDDNEKLRPFYCCSNDIPGFKNAILNRSGKEFKRKELAGILRGQYKLTEIHREVLKNLNLLKKNAKVWKGGNIPNTWVLYH